MNDLNLILFKDENNGEIKSLSDVISHPHVIALTDEFMDDIRWGTDTTISLPEFKKAIVGIEIIPHVKKRNDSPDLILVRKGSEPIHDRKSTHIAVYADFTGSDIITIKNVKFCLMQRII